VAEDPSPSPERSPAASLRLLAGVEAPEEAASFVREFCSASGFASDYYEVAVLVAGELVQKALRHGAVASTVEIQRADGGLRITVYDSTPVLPEQRSTPDEAPRPSAKAIWFELQVLE